MTYIIRHFLVKAQNAIVNYLVIFGNLTSSPHNSLTRLGTPYGGWWIPRHVIDNKVSSRFALSIGIGYDVSFDKEILENGFHVLALDPIAECVAFASKELAGFTGLYLENLGLATH